MQGYSPSLPIRLDDSDGSFAMNKTALDSIRQDLKMLLLTNPGEKMMDPKFGVGIKRYLFEQNVPSVSGQLATEIQKQIEKYINFVVVSDIQVFVPQDDENVLNLKIIFSIPSLNVTDQLNLSLQSN
jgi:phage baseplate assembly protein W